MNNKPAPGSKQALKLGCKCPVLDNEYGKGRGGDGERFGWYISGNCPIHDLNVYEEDDEESENEEPENEQTVSALRHFFFSKI